MLGNVIIYFGAFIISLFIKKKINNNKIIESYPFWSIILGYLGVFVLIIIVGSMLKWLIEL